VCGTLCPILQSPLLRIPNANLRVKKEREVGHTREQAINRDKKISRCNL
jgi:hypothetical protein